MPIRRRGAVFDEVDDALSEKLSALIWEGEQETLTLTRNAQPALMATSIAALRALGAEGVDVTSAKFVAGHSLGEYSALCAAGSLTLADTARLLRLRGTAMQDAVPCRRRRDGGASGAGFRDRDRGCTRGSEGRGVPGSDTIMIPHRSWFRATGGRSSVPSRSPRSRARSARCCCP